MNNKVAIYCRLSEEDRNKKNKTDDSSSIQNQKLMLTEYAFDHHWEIYDVYSDEEMEEPLTLFLLFIFSKLE